MKLSEAWFSLAKTFARTRSNFALCPQINQMFFAQHHALAERMKQRIALDLMGGGYWAYPAYGDAGGTPCPGDTRRGNREARVLACLMFGWEAKANGE